MRPPIGLRDCVKRLFSLREIVKTLFLLREFVKWHPCVMREKQKFHAWIRENPFFSAWMRETACMRDAWKPKSVHTKIPQRWVIEYWSYISQKTTITRLGDPCRTLPGNNFSTNAHISIFLERTWYYFWLILPHVVSVFPLLIPSPIDVGSTFSYKWKS